jgi:hypothetical protein
MPSPDRSRRRVHPQAGGPLKTALSPAAAPLDRRTIAKLIGASMLVGLMLVSLDVTPSSLGGLLDDLGPRMKQAGAGLWRLTETMVACLLAGAALVLPVWLVRRYRHKVQQAIAAANDSAPRS